MSKSYFNLREALEIGTNKIVDEYKKATPGQVAEAPEDDMPASQDEAGMAMDQAKFIGYVSKEIMEYLQGNNDFPEWMQNKLTGFHEKAKDMHAVMAGKYESVNEANYQVKAGKHAIGSASYDDKEIVTVTPQQAKKLTAYFQKNKDGDMWKKLFQGGGRGGKGAENQKDFDSMVAGLKESTELDEAAYKVPNNYAAMKARMNKNKKATDAQINKVLGPTKNAQQGVEALKKAFKVTDDEAKAMIGRVMPTEANRGSDSYRVKYKGDINTVRADSPEDALKKSMKAFGIGSMNKSDYMKNASAISEAIDMSKAGKYARVMNPKTREIKKVLKTDLKKYVDKGWTHMTQLKNRLTKEVSEAVNFHVRMDHLKDQESKLVVAILQKAEKSGSIKYKGESDKGVLFSAKSEPAVNTVTKDIAKVSRVADVEIMEKLEVSAGLGAWIKDFQASESPQFADKDDEEIRNMAIAAYLAAKREAKKGGDTSESSKAYGKTMSKQRDDKKKAGITDKDKQTLGKLADLMKREKR